MIERLRLIYACFAWLAIGMTALGAAVSAGDWPTWCGGPERNGVSLETGLPDHFDEVSADNPNAMLQNVKWVARLGAGTFGSPVVCGGRVYIGGSLGERETAALWCFREADGELLWRMRSPFWGVMNCSWGLCSTPAVEGDRVYVLGHHGEVLCLDANGLAGRKPSADDLDLISVRKCTNRGGLSADGHRIVEVTDATPQAPEPTDAHIVWRFDMLREVDCWPYNAQSSSILIRGERLYIATGSTLSAFGKDGSKYWIDEWKTKYGKTSYVSPSLIVLDKRTGKLLAVDNEGIFDQTFHGAHSSPALGVVNGKELLFYGAGNGKCYAFDPDFTPGSDGKPAVLRCVWQFDCLAASYSPGYAGPHLDRGEVVATPVFHDNRVYVAIGNDLAKSGSSAGGARLFCIDATGSGNITTTGRVWSFDAIRNTGSTVAVAKGLVYTADASGKIYCLDADTGELCWQDQAAPIWSSVLVADGKVYVATQNAMLVYAVGREKKLLGKTAVHQSMVSTPAAADGTLWAATGKYLYAVADGRTAKLDKAQIPTATQNGDWLIDREADKKARQTARTYAIAISVCCGAAAAVVIVRRRSVRRSKLGKPDEVSTR